MPTLLLLFLAVAGNRPPILDVHMHATPADGQGPPPLGMCTPIDPFPAWDPKTPYGDTFMALFKRPPCRDPIWSPRTDEEMLARTLAVLRHNNVIGVISGPQALVDGWVKADPERLMPAAFLQLDNPESPSIEALRALHAKGQLTALGEIGIQYEGLAPDDPRMEPYWQLAEELDVPVAIHVGPGPPGVIYLGSPKYRARLHSPLILEETLVRHPRLRVNVMHAGYPMLDDLLALLYAHPQVYVDTGVIVYTQPRPAFYRYLRGIVEAGFGNRVMFGSDQMVWPEAIERGIAVIEEATFLDPAQKRAILYDNAARFLRLDPAAIARHRAMGAPPSAQARK